MFTLQRECFWGDIQENKMMMRRRWVICQILLCFWKHKCWARPMKKDVPLNKLLLMAVVSGNDWVQPTVSSALYIALARCGLVYSLGELSEMPILFPVNTFLTLLFSSIPQYFSAACALSYDERVLPFTCSEWIILTECSRHKKKKKSSADTRPTLGSMLLVSVL